MSISSDMQKPPHQTLIGHVDRVDGETIVGWLANADDPGRLETVVCEDQAGGRVEFHAWHAREDVCDWLKLEGRFGFVIPLSALRELGDVLTIQDRQGTPLTNGSGVRIARTHSPPVVETTVLLHIPKTAGTSLRGAVVAGLLPSERLFLYPAPFGLTTAELASLPIQQRRAARMVVGHVHYGIDRFLGNPTRYVTFLREPLARLKSHAAHHASAGTGFHRHGAPVALSTVIEDGLDEQFDNLMVRVIAGLTADIVPLGTIGEKDVDLAMFNIERHFAMVGFVETIEADLARLSTLLGRTVARLGTENVSRADGQDRIGRLDWDRVGRRNRFDRMLYDRARASVMPAAADAPSPRRMGLVADMFGVLASSEVGVV